MCVPENERRSASARLAVASVERPTPDECVFVEE
jgi:hypothetical protein